MHCPEANNAGAGAAAGAGRKWLRVRRIPARAAAARDWLCSRVMNAFFFDLRYALRLLGRNPGFAATAILTLALGVGANSAIFAVVHAVLYRAPGYPEPGRVVAVTRTTPQSQTGNHSAADYLDIRRESRSFAALSAYRQDVLDFSGGNGDPERVMGGQVTVSFFDVFQATALVGRTFTEKRDDPRGERLIVLGHGIWQRRFAGDRAMVGRTIRVNREPVTVVGVMPPSFHLRGDAEAWILAPGPVPTPPLSVEGDLLANRQVHYFEAVGRLRPDVSLDQARTDLATVATGLSQRYPQTNGGQGLNALPYRELTTRDARDGLFILLAAVGFVLLVACANIAGLMLARATGRRQELAMRAALGAGRARLARQLLVESLVIGLVGGALGLLLASWGLDLLLALAPDNLPRVGQVRLDFTVTSFTLALGVAASLLFGVLPAMQAANAGLLTLRSGEARVAGRGSRRLMSALVVVEVALGVILTVGAGLTVNTLLALKDVNPGYLTDNVVRAPLPLPASRYGTSDQQADFYTRLLERLEENPVTRLSAAVFPPPLSGAGASGGLQIEGRPQVTDRERPVAAITWASPGYFKVMGIPLLKGRDFDARDVRGATPVALVSETAASRLWPGEDPLGKRFNFGDADPQWVTVAGIVGDIRHAALALSPEPVVYFPIRQSALPLMTIMVRGDAGPGPVASAVRSAVRQLDPELPVSDVEAFSDSVADSIGESRLRATLLSGFAAAALLLAAIGVYGLLSYTVAQRAREIGIRLALGASPGRVYREVVAGGLKLALAGLALGVPAALALSRLIASQLFGIGAADPTTFAGVTALLVVVALAASVGPARKVLAIDPVTALRAE